MAVVIPKMSAADWGVGARESAEMPTSLGGPMSPPGDSPLLLPSPIFALFCRTLPRADLLLRGRPERHEEACASPRRLGAIQECEDKAS